MNGRFPMPKEFIMLLLTFRNEKGNRICSNKMKIEEILGLKYPYTIHKLCGNSRANGK
jgi:hypothetical protein